MTSISTKEIRRKTFHVICTSILACIMLYHNPSLLYALWGMLAAMVVYEIARERSIYFTYFIQVLGMQAILRDHEKTSLTGATYTVIASLISYFLFQPFTAMLGLLILAWSDTAAAIFGMYYGGKKIHGKTISGSIAFCVTACLILIITACCVPTSPAYWFAGISAACISTLVERYVQLLNIDDNLAIPLGFGISFESIIRLIHFLT